MATMLYTGKGVAGDWADPANWKGDKAPGTADLAQIVDGASATVDGAVSVNAIMIINGGTDTFTGAVTTAGVGNCQGLMVCVGSTVVFAPGASLHDGGVLQVGVGGVGVFVADGTGGMATTITSKTGTIGKLAAGTGTVAINDASWTTTGSLVVGDFGTGTLNVSSGGHVTVGGTYAMGAQTGAAGHATLSTGGMITVDGGASIGGGGASAPPGTGTLTVDSGSTFDVENGMSVGSESTVELAGGTVSAGDKSGGLTVMAGGQITGYGTLTVRPNAWISDNGSIVANGGALQINASVTGQGSIVVDDNSTVAITGKSLQTPTFSFVGADSTLSLAHGATVKSNLTGFTFGDQIEMAGIDAAAWNSATQTLKLSDAGKTVDTLHLGGSYANDVFTVTQANGVGVIALHPAP